MNCILAVISYFILFHTIYAEEDVYLAAGGNPNDPSSSTIWILQERTNKILLDWIPFTSDSIENLQLLRNGNSYRDLDKDTTTVAINTVGSFCESDKYEIHGKSLTLGFIPRTRERKSLIYKRVPRVINPSLVVKNNHQSSTEIQWDLEGEPCEMNSYILIFTPDSYGAFEMHIQSTNNKHFVINRKLNNTEEVIMTITTVRQNITDGDARSTSTVAYTKVKNTPSIKGVGIPWKPLLIGVIYMILLTCIGIVIYFCIKH
ncbi:unnamed protein product [Heterobilharzia americana]|nr:unnamed protein product [Heterobilharzia americana]